jgi:Fe-Mn family superoxide dismutase
MSITLPPLPCALNALDPNLSRRALIAHCGNQQAADVAKTRALIQQTPLESASREDIMLSSAHQDTVLFSASTQAWNHEFYWRSMRRRDGSEVRGSSAKVIEESFGGQRALSQQFVTVAGISGQWLGMARA